MTDTFYVKIITSVGWYQALLGTIIEVQNFSSTSYAALDFPGKRIKKVHCEKLDLIDVSVLTKEYEYYESITFEYAKIVWNDNKKIQPVEKGFYIVLKDCLAMTIDEFTTHGWSKYPSSTIKGWVYLKDYYKKIRILFND